MGYLGTKGTRLDQQFIPNSVAPGATESSLPHDFTYETSNGDSIYHAAQFQLNRRFHSGFMWHTSYQFSKSIDNAGTGGRGQGNTPVAQNWLDLAAERGLSSFDPRHNLSMQLQYSSGMGTSGGTLMNGWKGALLKDWTVSATSTCIPATRSPRPWAAALADEWNGRLQHTARRCDGLAGAAIGQLFNTAAFTQPASGHWGNAGRDTIPGPPSFLSTVRWARVPARGTAQHRLPGAGTEHAQPRDHHQLGHGARVQHLRPGIQCRRHAQSFLQSAVQVLSHANSYTYAHRGSDCPTRRRAAERAGARGKAPGEFLDNHATGRGERSGQDKNGQPYAG